MAEVRFVDKEIETTVKGLRKTADGYLVGEVHCARTGIQQYTREEMMLDGAGLVNVYRPEATVFHKDSLASYAGKPITLIHPQVPVTADNWKDVAVGQIGESIARDGEMVKVSFAIMDAETIRAIEQDGIREVSMGYTTPVEMRDGVAPDGTPYQAVQTGPLRINHLAVVPKARGGADLRLGLKDQDANWGASPVIHQKDQKPMNKMTIDGITVEVTDQAREVITKLQGQLADSNKLVSDHVATIATKDRELAQKDTELTQKDKDIEDAKKAVPTGPALDALVAERQAVVDAAKAIKADLKMDGMSNADIKKAVVRDALTASVVDAKLAGKSEDYVDAFYDANFDNLKRDSASTQTLADGVANLKSHQFGDTAKQEEEAFEKSKNRFERKKK